ncbi:MAG: hypothetical protein ABH825_01010, partial [Candidatus Omnitrophota bacterium]
LISPTFYTRLTMGDINIGKVFADKESRHMSFFVLNGSIANLGSGLLLTDAEGMLEIKDRRLIIKGLKGKLFGIPVVINGYIKNLEEKPLPMLRISFQAGRLKGRMHIKGWRHEKGFSVSVFAKFMNRFPVKCRGRVDANTAGIFTLKDFTVNDKFALEGSYDYKNKAVNITATPDAGAVKFEADFSKEEAAGLKIRLDHINLFGSDIKSDIIGYIYFPHAGEGREGLRVELYTQNLIVNYKPFKEIKGSFVFKSCDELLIDSVELGREYKFSGSVDLKGPYGIKASLELNGGNLSDWAMFFPTAGQDVLSGIIFGKIDIEGPLKNPVTQGRLEFRDGNIQDVSFDVINIKVAGQGPLLTVSDSRIFKEGGFLIIHGVIDLRKLGGKGIFKDLQVETDQRVIVWDGWDVTKDIDTSEVTLRKDISNEFRVNFKGYTERDREGYDRKNEIGLDYKMEKDDSLNVRMREDGTFVGVEHRVKF